MSEPLGQAEALAPVREKTPGDIFENAIRALGVVAACEWFGYRPDSEFTKQTIEVLRLRSEQSKGS